MTITFDGKARHIYWRQMQRIVEWLLSEPPADQALGPASRNEMVLNYLDKSLKFGDHSLHLRLLDHFAATLYQSSNLTVLDRHLTLALAQEMPNAERIKLASLHIRLLTQRGDLERAEEVLEGAWAAADTPLLQAELYNRRGILLEIKAEYQASQSAYIQGLTLAQTHGNLRLVSIIYNNLGNWACAMERYEEALDYYQKALQVAESLNVPIHCARAEGGLAMALDMLKRYDDALTYYQLARRDYEQAGNLLGLVRTDLNMSEMFIDQGNYKKAKPLASRARIEAHQLGDLHREATALRTLGHIFLKEGDYESASHHLILALEIQRGLDKPLYEKAIQELIDNIAEKLKHNLK